MKSCSVILSAFLLPLLASNVARAQELPGKRLVFDVATIKPASPLDMQRLAADLKAGRKPKIGPEVDISRASYTYMSLDQLIALAYSVQLYQLSGPSWLPSQRFDIEAKLPEGATKEEAPAMLRALLEERFHLVAHQAQEEHKVPALVVGKSGLKIKESAVLPQPIDPSAPLKPGEQQIDGPDGPTRTKVDPDGSVTVNMGAKGTVVWKTMGQNQSLHLMSNGLSMAGYAQMLSYLFLQMGGASGAQVVDMTGLKGYYQIDVEISLADLRAMARTLGTAVPAGPTNGADADSEASDPSGGLGIYDSIKQMGLRLEERRATVERLVIDHIEKTPTEN